MQKLSSAARFYIAVVVIATAILVAALLSKTNPPADDPTFLALALGILVAVANLFPLPFAYRRNVSLDSAVIFAAVLLFDSGIAVLIAGLGCLAGDLISSRKRAWGLVQIVFNACQTALQAGVGALVLMLAGWNHADYVTDQGTLGILMAVVAAFVMYMANTILVAIVVGLESGQAPLAVWRQSADIVLAEQLSEFALGLLAAIVIGPYPLALPLLIFPAIAVYYSLERHVQLRRQTIAAVESMADMVDIRDPYTANHSRALATELGLRPEEIDLVERAARVHDLGKIMVDAAVLTKRGKLTSDDEQQLRQHPIIGAQILSRFPQFSLATSYVRHHHERMDGSGYPDGLKGADIPMGARIIAVADAFDSMSMARPYRCGLSMEVVLSELAHYRGSQWDEQIVDTLTILIERERISVPRGANTSHPAVI